jgi:hypothetical protein
MLRIPRDLLDAAIQAVQKCCANATDVSGHRVVFTVTDKGIEHMICGGLSIVAPNGGPVTPEDIFYVVGFGGKDFQSFPKNRVPSHGDKTGP